jgi:malate/lactate dehydrogenase
MFKDADVIVFIGGFPRKKGMERKDLLDMNKKIFIEQSKALSSAKKTVKCVVVANPANTNAYILSYFNPDIPKKNITCLTRLDHNRAVSQITQKTKSRP